MSYKFSLCCIALLVCAGSVHAQDVYKWVDEKGQVHYGNAPSDKGATKVEMKIPPPVESQHDEAADRAARNQKAWNERTQKEAEKAQVARKAPPPSQSSEPEEAPTDEMSCEARKKAYEDAGRCFAKYRNPGSRAIIDPSAYDRCPNVKRPDC
jgi:hypothetical protein